MFFSRKKEREYGAQTVVITDINGVTLFSGNINSLPIHERIIIQKSIEYFNDPEPCYIHKGAVCMRIYMEIEQEVLQFDGQTIIIDMLSESIRSYIDL